MLYIQTLGLIKIMKYLSFFIFILLVSKSGFSQKKETESKSNSTSRIKVELIIPKDTLYMEQGFPLHLRIFNKTNKPIFIPSKTDFISNLYPNGVNEIWDGAIVKLKIEPSSGFASIYQENIQMVKVVEFVKIKPKSSVVLYLGDLKRHIQTYNERIDSDDLKVKTASTYTLQVKYINNRIKKGKEKQTFLGKSSSQKKILYIEW